MHLQQSSIPQVKSIFTHPPQIYFKVNTSFFIKSLNITNTFRLNFLMNFNEQIQSHQPFVLHTEEDESYQSEILQSSDTQNIIHIKSQFNRNLPSKGQITRGKENDCHNTIQSYSKNATTNHSFNGFFNQNTYKPKKNTNQSTYHKTEMTEVPPQNYQINSPTNFNSTGKLSNLQFVGDSSKNYEFQQNMHSEVKSLVKKYFAQNLECGKFKGKYVSVEHLVEILFEEFEDLIGKQNGFSLLSDFTDKVFLVFGDRVYFEELFEKTFENGLTGLVFQIVKSINEDRKQSQAPKENRNVVRPTQSIQPKSSLASKYLLNSGLCSKRNQNRSQTNKINGMNLQFSDMSRCPSQKISLDRFFGNSVSKVQFHEDHNFWGQQNSCHVNEQNLQEIKSILQDYIQSMYEEAESKLNKKYAQQMKKIVLKYKETQKILEKVNDKISNHYDTIQLQKQYEKKIQIQTQKQTELQEKIKNLEYELKSTKDDVEKQKLNSFKLDQDMNKLKEKLDKYENAIFEKAMEKGSNNNSVNGSSIIKQTSSLYSQHQSQYQQQISQQKVPRFQVKIDTFTQHKPIHHPTTPLQPQNIHSPYVSRHVLTNNGGLTPTRIRQLQRVPSVSPIKQRISFVKTQNPPLNQRVNQPSDVRPGSSITKNDNSRVIYTNNINNVTTQQNEYNRLKFSNVEKIEVGQKIQLRPLSPIGKLGQMSLNLSSNHSININQTGITTPNNQSRYAQRTHSPIKVQFCTSRVSNVPVQNR